MLLACSFTASCTAAPEDAGSPGQPTDVNAATLEPDERLESLFPDTIGGNAIQPASAQGPGMLVLLGNSDPTRFNQFLADVGASMDQVSGAISSNEWPGSGDTNSSGITIIGLRIAGVESSRTLEGFAELAREDVPNAQIGAQTIGGKNVTAITNPENGEDNVYLYGTGDVVFMIGGTATHVEEAFTQLP